MTRQRSPFDRGNIMPLHTPSAWTFWLSVVLAVLAVISRVALIPHLAQYAGWIGLVGYLVLVAGCTIKTM